MNNLRDYIEVHSRVFCGRAIVSIKEKIFAPGMTWRVKLVHNKKAVYLEEKFTRKKNWICRLDGAGCWLIFIEVKDKEHSFSPAHIRESFWCYSKNQKSDYKKFLADYSDEKERVQLPFAELKEPYQNMALVYYDKKQIDEKTITVCAKKIDSLLHVYTTDMDGGYGISVLSQQAGDTLHDGSELFFSGKTKYNNKLVFGQKDISSDTDTKVLLDEVGYFSAIKIKNTEVLFTNDYFGIYPIYVCEGKSVSVFANSFHLLILLLKGLGISLELDVEHIIPYFTCGERMLFEQLASHETFIKGIRKIPIHSKVVINAAGCHMTDKSIGKLMRNPEPYDEEMYQSLMKDYADEIAKNVQVACKDTRFKDVILDVSGGKDSRVILGAALREMPEGSDRIRINSIDVPAKKDKESFIPLNHVHPFKYDNEKDTLKVADVRKRTLQRRSVYLGTQFAYTLPWRYERSTGDASRLQLTGAGGDMLLCAYFPMSFPQICYDSFDKLVDSYSPLYNNGIINYKNIEPYVRQLISEGMSEVVGSNLYEQLNNYYLYYRNTYHFGPEIVFRNMESSIEQWFPLYSKTGFRIRQMISQRYKGIKFSIDLIDYLAPILLKIPFNDPKYNRELQNLLKNNPDLLKDVRNIPVEINNDATEWEEAQKEKAQGRVVLSSEAEQNKAESEEKEIIEAFYDTAMSKLNKMLHYNEKFEKVLGIDLYLKFVQNEKELREKKPSKDFNFLFNKIIAVTDLIDIAEQE